MANYNVDVQTVEVSDIYVAVTGAVNKRQVATTVRKEDVPMQEPARKTFLARALALKFAEEPSEAEGAAFTKVSL